MTKARSIFNKDTLTSLYYSFIYPYINYCIHVWGSTFHSYVNKVFLLQKRVVRIIAGVNRRTHSKPIFHSLCILPVDKVFAYNMGLFMYKYHHGWLSQIFELFKKNSDIHEHYTRQSHLLHLSKPNTEQIRRSFPYQAFLV